MGRPVAPANLHTERIEEDDMAYARPRNREVELRALLTRDHTLTGGILFGLDGHFITVQARAVKVFNGPVEWRAAVSITGMARGTVCESLDRIAGAFAKLQLPEPEVEILINLAPADLPKDGTWLDLPLAVIMLQAAGVLPDLPETQEGDYVLLGEIGLHGEVRRVPGVLSLAYNAKPGQILIVPAGNEKECALIMGKSGHEGCSVCRVAALQEVVDFFKGTANLKNALSESIEIEPIIPRSADFSRIKGQDQAKRAAIIAAAGGHNLLLIGPPGEGKSLLSSAIAGILPRLENHEKVELTRIYSACGALERDGMAVTRRPFRSVHHSASKQALVGGGSGVPRPGEITMAHMGILFLDEIPEFSGPTLESLRQPLEAGEVTISRVGGTMRYPARFTLVAAMNPCPCGYWGTELCRCTAKQVQRYQSKISGPILDRIDLQVEMARLSTEERFAENAPEASPAIREKVEEARERQIARFKESRILHNADIPGGRVRDYCMFSTSAFDHYKKTIESSVLSTRSMDRLAKVARTVADLAASDTIEPEHIDEAATFVIGGVLRSTP
jgi:magnesium chelatase family protein